MPPLLSSRAGAARRWSPERGRARPSARRAERVVMERDAEVERSIAVAEDGKQLFRDVR